MKSEEASHCSLCSPEFAKKVAKSRKKDPKLEQKVVEKEKFYLIAGFITYLIVTYPVTFVTPSYYF